MLWVVFVVALALAASTAVGALYPHAPSLAKAKGIITTKPVGVAKGIIGCKACTGRAVAQEMPPFPRRPR